MQKGMLVFGFGALVACADSGDSFTTDSAVGPSGGNTGISTGGQIGNGGTVATGGMTGTAGKTNTGGTTVTGGSSTTNSGGAITTGGTIVIGGKTTGGTIATGGSTVTGGSTSTGGNATCGAVKPAEAPPGITPLRAIDGFVTRKDSDLMLCDKPFHVMGTNLYYAQSYSSYGPNEQKVVRDALDDAVRLSLPVVRMWAFYDGTSADTAIIQKSPEKYEPVGLIGLDTAIAEAKKRGIRVILTLSNYWENAYGGLPQYAVWAGAKSKHDFYTNATMQGYFMSYASELSKRTNTITNIPYKDEPAILAWEIANELRCPKCPIGNIQNTVSKLAGYLKTLFPKHLIADGGEGMDDNPNAYAGISNEYAVRGDEGASFSSLVNIPELDMVSYHYYPVDWGMTKVETDSAIWINTHQAIAQKAKKVGYWGEFGYKKFASDSERAPIYDRWLTSFFSTANNGSTSLFWQLLPNSRQGGDDGYGVFLTKDTATVAVFNKYAIPRAPR